MKPIRKAMRALAALSAALALVAAAARADAADRAFVYTTRAEPHTLRMAIEELGVLALGVLQYTSTKSNEADWDVRVDWPGVRSKLLWGAASFDDNRFDTNWLTHPAAGFLYYSTARGNRLGVLPSFATSLLAATVWEEIGEIREHVAVNDVVVTPLSAVPLGESALQLGAFLHRGRRTPMLIALGWLFAPWKSVHDAVDGVTPQGAYAVDDLGLPADVWHRFAIGGSAGVNVQQQGSLAYDGRALFHTELVTLPGYHREGRRSVVFGAGEVTSTRFQLGASSGRVVDLSFAAASVPAGWYWQDVHAGPDGSLRGSETLAGLHMSAEYTTHAYDRDGRRPDDRLALVAVGGTVEETVHTKAFRLRTRLEILGAFAGVNAYALKEYQRALANEGLTSVLRKEHYYHAYGATIRPQLDVTAGRLDAGAEARFDGFQAVENVDVEGPLEDEVSASDRRISARAWLGVKALDHVRIFVAGERNERSGSVGTARASRSELAAHLGGELVF
jgi:hypothetical protein